jgi:hypothetical protein|uniref:Uncharacterized protein n=1 Tax=Picea glauca TaxID=3330 RepID=A0A117NH58_PICGL|nr:hypothetical protein ABT39_MTgene4867 [Picea glauca]QHR92365.1 hypothetical protein Q903MT_gene6408 [Picea sitchensis]
MHRQASNPVQPIGSTNPPCVLEPRSMVNVPSQYAILCESACLKPHLWSFLATHHPRPYPIDFGRAQLGPHAWFLNIRRFRCIVSSFYIRRWINGVLSTHPPPRSSPMLTQLPYSTRAPMFWALIHVKPPAPLPDDIRPFRLWGSALPPTVPIIKP